MKIRGIYKFTFYSGKEEVIQYKNLISHIDYINHVKSREIAMLSIEGNKSIKKENREKLITELKDEIKQLFGENYFTDNSPLYLNRESGKLKLEFIKDRDVYINYKIERT